MNQSEIRSFVLEAIGTQSAKYCDWIAVWLSAGVKAVAIAQLDGTIISQWPKCKERLQPLLIENVAQQEPLYVANRPIGSLCIFGELPPSARSHLAADAKLLSIILTMESESRAMTEDIIQHQDQMMALYQLAQQTRGHSTLEESMKVLVRIMTRSLDTEDAFLILHDQEGGEEVAISPPSSSRELIWTKLVDRLPERRVNDQWRLTAKDELLEPFGSELRNVLIRKAAVHKGTVLYLGVANKQSDMFRGPDVKLFDTIAGPVVTIIKNMILHRETLNQARIQTEMDLAKKIQMSLLPQQTPQFPGVEVAARSLPASEVGGDFYDFTFNESLLSFCLGDVSGKGMGAALFMAMLRTVLRGKATEYTSSAAPGEILDHANAQLYTDFSEIGMFATVFQGQYNIQDHTLYFANDGHAPVIYRSHCGLAKMLEADNPPLGILPYHDQSFRTLPIGIGDIIVIASDGITEAEQSDGEMFGYNRLLELIDEHANSSANELLETIFTAIENFAGEEAQSDDQTVVVVKRTNYCEN